MLNLTLLGTGGGMPLSNRFLSSLIINYKGRKILVDCGEGTQVAMRKMKTGFKSVDIICLTHMHGDHIFGLPGFLTTLGNCDRTEPVTVIGFKGINKALEGLMSCVETLPFELKIIEAPKESLAFINSSCGLKIIEQKKHQKAELIISAIELEHRSPCLGYSFYLPRKPEFSRKKAEICKIPMNAWSRLQKGEIVIDDDKIYEPDMVMGDKRKGIKLSYIVDTRPVKSIPTFIMKSNLFICEGTYGDDGDLYKAIKNKHLTFREAAELARAGEVDGMLLTHFSPVMDDPKVYKSNADEVFKNTIIGYDGFTKTLSFVD